MDLGPDLQPRAIVADKGYDSAANRKAARRRVIVMNRVRGERL